GGHDRRWPGEARNVVHVAVGIVAGNAAAQPNDLIDAEIIGESALQLRAAQAGVALLHFAQKAFFGGEQSTFAVHVDRSALQHAVVLRTVLVLDEWLPMRTAKQFLHAAGKLVVETPVV